MRGVETKFVVVQCQHPKRLHAMNVGKRLTHWQLSLGESTMPKTRWSLYGKPVYTLDIGRLNERIVVYPGGPERFESLVESGSALSIWVDFNALGRDLVPN